MKRLVPLVTLGLVGLALLSAGCSQGTVDADEQAVAVSARHSAAERESLAELLGSGEISGATLDAFVSDDGLHIVYAKGGVKTVASTHAGAPAGEEPALDRLRANLAGGIEGAVTDLAELPPSSCDGASPGGPSTLDPSGLYLVPVDGTTFDLLTRTVLDAAEASGDDATDLARPLAEVEKKVAWAAVLPAEHTVLFFGRATVEDAQGRATKAWRVYAADVSTEACAAGLPHGTIDGQAFTPTSGTAFAAEGKTQLIFSTEAETCTMVQTTGVVAGATYVQIFGLGNEPGTYTSDDTKVAVIDATCASGAEPAIRYSVRQVPNGTVVTLTRVDDVVEGTLTATFEDGSTFAGSFSVPRCSGLGTAEPSCR